MKYTLDFYQLTSGNNIVKTATVGVTGAGIGSACGDGPLEALFKAIEDALPVEKQIGLISYQLISQGIGKSAIGQVLLQIACDGKIGDGTYESEDILRASAIAYIEAINEVLDKGE